MFSFSTLALFSTIAFGALSSALPVDLPVAAPAKLPTIPAIPALPHVGRGLGLPVVGDLNLPVDLPIRRDAVVGVAVIITETTTKLVPATNMLKFVKADNCTVDALSAPIAEIKDILVGTVAELKTLVGQPVEVILASVDGTVKITVHELAGLICGLLTLVFTALRAVLVVAGATVDKVLFDLLVVVGGVVGELIAIVLTLVGGLVGELLSILVPLLKNLVPVILHLNLAQVISLLHL